VALLESELPLQKTAIPEEHLEAKNVDLYHLTIVWILPIKAPGLVDAQWAGANGTVKKYFHM
jgi:hypothetical protein